MKLTKRLVLFLQFNSDYVSVVPTYEAALAHADAGATWLYSFGYFNQEAFPSDHLFKGT